MLVKELKEKLIGTKFERCADGIISLILDKPRKDIRAEDFISAKDAKICEEIASDYKQSYGYIYSKGKAMFMDLPFIVTKDVLPPVIATEYFIKFVIQNFKNSQTILEIGTGSGALAIAIKKSIDVRLVATDISIAALEIAKKNAELNGVDIEFIHSDVYKNVKGKFDVIISNPPQQTTENLDKVEKSGQLLTPRIASDGGYNGSEIWDAIVSGRKNHLNNNGVLVMQSHGVPKLYHTNEL